MAVPAGADAIKGKARVIDGDTIEIEGEEIRLAGIDAPEMGQWCRDVEGYRYRCGRKAAEFLQSGINDAVQCTDEPAKWIVVDGYAKGEGQMSDRPYKKHDDDGRMVAECVRVDEFLIRRISTW